MMHYMSNMILFLLMLIPHSHLVRGMYNRYEIQEDITKFNRTCEGDDCKDCDIDNLSSKNCHCGIQCVQFGSCCFDSAYAGISQPNYKPSCRSVNKGGYYFIVDRCSATHSAWADLCNTEWDGESDLQSITPVTSLFTSVTYKNYYCFRCYESNDDFLYWTPKLESRSKGRKENPPTSFIYDKEIGKWMVQYEDIDPFPVELSINFPNEIRNLAHVCIPGVISDCSAEWSDEDVRNKCQSYMALRSVKRNNSTLTYKNIHCALCNFESLNDITCKERVFGSFGFPCAEDYLWDPITEKCRNAGGSSVGVFAFTYLLDINRSDGELVGKVQRCAEDHRWDPFTKKCRPLSCALPGYELKAGKCVKE